MVPVDRVDAEVIDAFDGALLTADIVEEIVSRATALVIPTPTDKNDLQDELRRIDAELTRLTDAVAGGLAGRRRSSKPSGNESGSGPA